MSVHLENTMEIQGSYPLPLSNTFIVYNNTNLVKIKNNAELCNVVENTTKTKTHI